MNYLYNLAGDIRSRLQRCSTKKMFLKTWVKTCEESVVENIPKFIKKRDSGTGVSLRTFQNI